MERAPEENRQALLLPIEELAGLLTEDRRLQQTRSLVLEAYTISAALFDTAPEWVAVKVHLGWKNQICYRRVPIRRIGATHFAPLKSRGQAAFDLFRKTYIEELSEDLEGVRVTLNYVLDLFQKSGPASSHEVQMGLDRIVNRLRDLSNPIRLIWEGLIWELQEEHQTGLSLVQTDVGRYGSPVFYLGKSGRRLKRLFVRTAASGLEATRRILPLLWKQVTALRARGFARLEPLLEWIGLIRPPALEVMQTLDEARLESVFERDLPRDYLAHFTLDPLADEALFVGFDEELATIDQAVERWENRLTTSFLVHGQRGSGKTSLLNIAGQRFFSEEQPILHASIERKMTTAAELVEFLTTRLELSGTESFDDLARALLAGPRRAILLEGCHNLFLRQIGGLEAMRHLLWLVARTNHHVLWGLCMGKYAAVFLAKSFPMSKLFHFEIEIAEWRPEALRRLIMVRHNQSGYSLRYAYDGSLEKALRRRVKRWRRPEEPAVQEALEQIFFERLAEVSGENLVVAIFYWLRSLRPQGKDCFAVVPLDELRLDLIRGFTLDQAFILNAILQHDNLTAEELARILDSDLIQVRLELEILVNQSILELDDRSGRFRINPVVLEPATAMLTGRNIAH